MSHSKRIECILPESLFERYIRFSKKIYLTEETSL